MALIDPKHFERLDIPDEPGEWVEIRSTTAGDLIGVEQRDDSTFVLLAKRIKAWSYDAPVNAESISRLDIPTFTFLSNYGLRSEDEKKDSGSQSSPTTEPGEANGPESWAT